MIYPVLDIRVSVTYAAKSSANLTKALYDSYIKAFRWATDRIADNSDGGIVAFISNGSWLDGNAQDGFRACLESEFTDIYVLNLRGNQRTSGELSRKEGGKIFGGGSRTPITITILVKNPAKNSKAATIHYHDIGDYLTREQKLNFIKKFKSVHGRTLDWEVINPTEKHDWINQRDGIFDQLIPVAPEKKFKIDEQSFFSTLSLGIATNKDTFLYDFSKESLCNKIESLISFYNSERMKLALNANYELQTDPTKIVWTDMFKNSAKKQEIFKLDYSRFVESCYRPFTKQNFIFQKDLIQRTGFSYSKAFFCMQWGRNFPESEHAGILFVGRATNGWITDEEDIDVLFGNTADRIFNRDDQMQWVENSEGNNNGYNSRRSAFWRVIKRVSEYYYPEDWSSYIAWSNVCKVAPFNGGNPNNELYYAQLETCLKILEIEIEQLSPRIIVFLTGENWVQDFLSYLNHENYDQAIECKSWGEYKSTAYLIKNTIMICSEHPQGKNENLHSKAIIDIINDLK